MRIDPRLVQRLRNARRVVALTGAGISAESGIPTFRDAQSGLWARFRPEELATPEAFPRLGTLVPDWLLVTQNVDGLHQRAGSRAVVELHGNIHRNKCFDEDVVVAEWRETGERPPCCPRCGGPLRPDVVWFGESLSPQTLAQAEAGARRCEVLFSIGTSAAVFPAAQLPLTALQAGAMVVEVNKDPTPLTGMATFSLLGLAGEILSHLLGETWPA